MTSRKPSREIIEQIERAIGSRAQAETAAGADEQTAYENAVTDICRDFRTQVTAGARNYALRMDLERVAVLRLDVGLQTRHALGKGRKARA